MRWRDHRNFPDAQLGERSGRTFLGIQVAARFPYLYHAYVAVGQMSNPRASLATDLAERIPKVDIPVYFLHGVHAQ